MRLLFLVPFLGDSDELFDWLGRISYQSSRGDAFFFGKATSAASLVGNSLLSRSLVPPSLSVKTKVANPPATFSIFTSWIHYLLKHMAHPVQAAVWTAGLDDRLADSGLIPF